MKPKDDISASAIDAKLNEFETKLDQLYRKYEQYFIGVKKRPPRHPRREVARMYRELEQLPMIKTSLKFRFRSLVQRFNSYKTYWNRTERQIEEGTYHRDLARAKARKKRRDDREDAQEQHEQAQASGKSEDGAFELDEIDLDLDLGSMEEELQQMDQRGEFEKYVGTKKVKHDGFPEDQKPNRPPPRNDQPRDDQPRAESQSGGWERPEVDEGVKQQRLAELQAKLGLSSRPSGSDGGDAGPAAGDGGRNPFERSAEGPTQKARPENPSAPSRGADMSKIRKLRRAKERIEREQGQNSRGARKDAPDSDNKRSSDNRRSSGPNRVIRRGSRPSSGSTGSSASSSDEHSRKIYNNLVEAKRRCKEDTSNLNYDSFKRTMDRQRSQIQKKKGARDVDFKVVIKEGRAFLKPETKK
jgi:hypothetical protein